MGSGAPAKAGRNACRKRNVTYLPGGPGKREEKSSRFPCHAAGWANGQVAFPSPRDTNSAALQLLVCIPRSGPSSPMGLPSTLLFVTLRIGRAAGSITPTTAPPNRRRKRLPGLPASALSLSPLRAYPRASCLLAIIAGQGQTHHSSVLEIRSSTVLMLARLRQL